jgi:phosphoserine/homoserine phosphotransferase
MPDHKRETVKRLQQLNFNVVAAGDSYNDTTMLGQAEQGILFCPPQKVIEEFPQFPVATSYPQLRNEIDAAMSEMIER